MASLGQIVAPAIAAILGVAPAPEKAPQRPSAAPIMAPLPKAKPVRAEEAELAQAPARAAKDDAPDTGTQETPAAAQPADDPPSDEPESPDEPARPAEAPAGEGVPAEAGPETVTTAEPQKREEGAADRRGAVIEPVPKAKPDRDSDLGALVLPVPRPKPVRARAAEGQGARLAALPSPAVVARRAYPEDPQCLAKLEARAVSFKRLPDNRKNGCGLEEPLSLSEIGKDDVLDLSPAPTLGCGVATAFVNWVEGAVQREAMDILGKKVTAMRISDSYSCRGRNNIIGARVSEHAFGNAIDIGAFRIGEGKDAKWVEVKPAPKEPNEETRFLDAVRKAACEHFTTVLGPGQPYHDNHLHLDLGWHGRTGTHRICQ